MGAYSPSCEENERDRHSPTFEEFVPLFVYFQKYTVRQVSHIIRACSYGFAGSNVKINSRKRRNDGTKTNIWVIRELILYFEIVLGYDVAMFFCFRLSGRTVLRNK